MHGKNVLKKNQKENKQKDITKRIKNENNEKKKNKLQGKNVANPREEISMEENSRGLTDTWVLITVEMHGKNV